MLAVLSSVAEVERETILVQTMEGRRQKAREGEWNGGFAPYGYYLENGDLKIDEEEARAIRIIFDKFVHTDMGYNGVVKYLQKQGVKKKARQNGYLEEFSVSTVKAILDNPVYAGKIAYGRRKSEKKVKPPDEGGFAFWIDSSLLSRCFENNLWVFVTYLPHIFHIELDVSIESIVILLDM
jgi:site-specific DNA recombinase